MYSKVRRLRGVFFWLALLGFLLWLKFPDHVPIWLAIGLACVWLIALGYGVLHVAVTRRRELRCPLCGWVPYAIEAWKCKGCGRRWDSFSTRGICPQCQHQHEETACLRCRMVSPNPKWQCLSE